MTAILPSVLFKAKRGLCPGCGAPLSLDTPDAQATCGFCGQKAVLERRLRKVEPEVPDAPLRLYVDDQSAEAGDLTRAGWVRSKQYREAHIGSAACPGCGDVLEYEDDQLAIHCKTCGTDSRLERRLWTPPPDPETEIARPRHPAELQSADRQSDDPATEHLVYRILLEKDADHRLALVRAFEQWIYINSTAARLLPTLLAATRDAEPAFQYAAAQVICKLLCEGDPALRNTTVRAVERFLFDTQCSRAIVLEVGMGDGVCLKPLLDAAEFAWRRGDLEYSCACLVAINWIFQRNFPHHEIMGQIILYRMLYLTGPVLAFALLLAQRQVTGTGFHYTAETLLHFIDDASVERPSLMPELEKCFYLGWPKDDAEFQHRFDVYSTLKTDSSRAAALRHYVRVPDDAKPQQWKSFLAFVMPILDAAGPLTSAAEAALESVVSHSYPTPDAVHELVKDRGKSLPTEVQRAYLRSNEKNPYISYEGLPCWQSKPEPGISQEMKLALEQWKVGLHAAVDAHGEIRRQATERLAAVRDLELKVFDGKSDGPPPKGYETEIQKKANDEVERIAQKLKNYQQALQHLESMKEQLKQWPQTVAGIDQQIAELKTKFTGTA